MNYWTATDEIIMANGGHNPVCSECGGEMYAEDDHGRFSCGCGARADLFTGAETTLQVIPQISSDVVLTDAQKAEIPPMYRLHHAPTAAEQKVLEGLLDGLKDLLSREKCRPGSRGKQ